MREALHAEWTKLRTVPATGGLLAAAAASTVAVSALVTASVSYSPSGEAMDTTRLSLSGVVLGQAVVAVLGVLVIAGEYTSGLVRTTLVAMPRRTAVLAAKATTLCGLVTLAGLIAVVGSLVAGRVFLPGNGFTVAHGYPPVSLVDGATLRAAAGSVCYLALVALLSLGVATAVREPALAIGAVLGLLYLFPILAHVVSNPHWQRHLEQASPMNAGLAIQATRNLSDLPIGPWAGLGVLGLWAAVALLSGGFVLRLRDA